MDSYVLGKPPGLLSIKGNPIATTAYRNSVIIWNNFAEMQIQIQSKYRYIAYLHQRRLRSVKHAIAVCNVKRIALRRLCNQCGWRVRGYGSGGGRGLETTNVT